MTMTYKFIGWYELKRRFLEDYRISVEFKMSGWGKDKKRSNELLLLTARFAGALLPGEKCEQQVLLLGYSAIYAIHNMH